MSPTPVAWRPLTFRPVYKDYIWGGDRIVHKYGRENPGGLIAESWEVSTRPEGMSIVASGPSAGRSLQDLVDARGVELLGDRAPPGRFPLLIKLIDARERLSVQVHPDETSAPALGGEPKTEAWHVLDANPGATLFAGLRPGIDRAAMNDAIRHTRIEATLGVVPVGIGDTVFIPGGAVHALDAGLTILEVQQNSNTTYRLYDWGRVGHDGRPRETHVAEALRAIRWDLNEQVRAATATPLPCPPPNGRDRLVACPYFVMDRIRLFSSMPLDDDPGAFRVLFAVEGAVVLVDPAGSMRLEPGRAVLLPAALRKVRLMPAADAAALIFVTLP